MFKEKKNARRLSVNKRRRIDSVFSCVDKIATDFFSQTTSCVQFGYFVSFIRKTKLKFVIDRESLPFRSIENPFYRISSYRDISEWTIKAE